MFDFEPRELPMSRTIRWFVTIGLALSAGLWTIAISKPAEACTPAPCQGGGLLPVDGGEIAVLPSGQEVSFVWQPRTWGGSRQPKPSDVTLTETQSGQSIGVTLKQRSSQWPKSWLVRPEQSLSRNSTYRLEAKSLCNRGSKKNQPLTSTFQTGRRIFHPVPRAQLQVGSQTRERIRIPSGASCSTSIPAATVPLTVKHGGQARKWTDLFIYETRITGPSGETKTWKPRHSSVTVPPLGGSWEGRGRDLLYASCQQNGRHADSGLEEGVTYEVSMRLSLPGTNITTTTNEVSVTLRCGPSNGDVGVDAGPSDAGPSIDVTQRDAAPSRDVGQRDTRFTGDTNEDEPDVSDVGGNDEDARDRDIAIPVEDDASTSRSDTEADRPRDAASDESDVHWSGADGGANRLDETSGCTCSSGSTSPPLQLSWLFLLIGLVWSRRRFVT
jgi:MYXO-CTERM domain-containing protein